MAGNSRLFEIPQGTRHFTASSIPIYERDKDGRSIDRYCGEGTGEACAVTFRFDYYGALPLPPEEGAE